MVVKNALDVAEKVVKSMKLDSKKIMGVFERYLERRTNFLKKEDIFSEVFNLKKMIMYKA